MSEDSRRSKRRSSRRISAQRERSDDDEYDYYTNNEYKHRRRNHFVDQSSTGPSTKCYSSYSGNRRPRDERRSSKHKTYPPKMSSVPAPQSNAKLNQKARNIASVENCDNDEDTNSVTVAKMEPKWHQYFWVRILLGILMIVITIIITFLVLRETGLSLDENEDESFETKKAGRNSPTGASPTELVSGSPSTSPTSDPFFTYLPPNNATCQKKSFVTGDASFVNGESTREFEFSFDLTLSNPDPEGFWLQEFESKIQSTLVPILVGCSEKILEDQRKLWMEPGLELNIFEKSTENENSQLRGPGSRQKRPLENLDRRQHHPRYQRRMIDSDEFKIRFVISDAAVIGAQTLEISCLQNLDQDTLPQTQPSTCYRLAIYIDLLLRGEERVFPMIQLLTALLNELSDPNLLEPSEDSPKAANEAFVTSLPEKLGLSNPPFLDVTVVGITNRDPTQSPSASPTQTPTSSPSAEPSALPTKMPTLNPSMAPSSGPTERPSINPTMEPTRKPSFSPTVSPQPSSPPSGIPSTQPTSVPTNNSAQPSDSFQPSVSQRPSCADFWEEEDTDDQDVDDPNDPDDLECESEDED